MLPRAHTVPLCTATDAPAGDVVTAGMKELFLRGSPALRRVLRTFCHVANQYCYLRMLMGRREGTTAASGGGDRDLLPASHFTWPAFRWAVATAMTRQNLIPAVARGPDGTGDKGDITNAMALIPWVGCPRSSSH